MLFGAATRSAISGKLAVVENAQGLAKNRQEGDCRQNKDGRERKGDMRNVSAALITGVLADPIGPRRAGGFCRGVDLYRHRYPAGNVFR
jgi:hypothetical protein